MCCSSSKRWGRHDLRTMRSKGGRCRRLSNKIPQWLHQTTIIGPDGDGDLGPAGMGANVGSSSILQQGLSLNGQPGLARLGLPSVQLLALRTPNAREWSLRQRGRQERGSSTAANRWDDRRREGLYVGRQTT
jgi:hypothetical protein